MTKRPKYNSAISISFSVDHDCKDPLDLPLSSLVAALLQRVSGVMLEHPQGAKEAFEVYDTTENPEKTVSNFELRLKAAESFIGSYQPCPHHNSWKLSAHMSKCDDCGNEFPTRGAGLRESAAQEFEKNLQFLVDGCKRSL